MIEKYTLAFLSKLKKNNKKEWFDKNRTAYDAARHNMEMFVTALLANMTSFEPAVGTLAAKKCLFRINRDIRFSKDKSPYKTNFGASINPGGKNSPGPGYYIHIEPGKSFLGGGVYMPEPGFLNAIRQEIDYNLKEFEKILKEKKFKNIFGDLETIEKLQRPPKGYDESNPAIDYLKHKHYTVFCTLTDAELNSKSIAKKAAGLFELMKPFNNFLARARD
jgi:uncharacterized protein (TIGR02453 family)